MKATSTAYFVCQQTMIFRSLSAYPLRFHVCINSVFRWELGLVILNKLPGPLDLELVVCALAPLLPDPSLLQFGLQQQD